MFAVRNETLVAASPLRIWAALTRFENYYRWHPFVRMLGLPLPGHVVDYSFRMRWDFPQFDRLVARIRSIDGQAKMVTTFGLGWLVFFKDAYLFLPSPVGVRLIHSLGCRGLQSLLLPHAKAEQNVANLLETTDFNLVRYLSSVLRARAVKPWPTK